MIFHIAQPEIVPKAFRFNTKAAINDFLKYPSIALNDCKDLHIYDRLKKMICILAIMFNSLYEMMILFIKKENHTQKRRIAFYISKFKSGDREMAIF